VALYTCTQKRLDLAGTRATGAGRRGGGEKTALLSGAVKQLGLESAKIIVAMANWGEPVDHKRSAVTLYPLPAERWRTRCCRT